MADLSTLSLTFCVLISCLVALIPVASANPQSLPGERLTSAERTRVKLFKSAGPSVVHVAARKPSAGEYGAGIVWDARGHIVTNNHVVKDAKSVMVVFSSGELFPAHVIGTAINYDIAVLKIDGNASNLPPPLTQGRSDNLQVGQSVFAIGNPFGFDQTLTVGIVSALRRRMRIDKDHELANAIQLGASINPGDSGGPVLDSSGKLIGMTTAVVSASGGTSGVGFAIPSETLNRVVPQLIDFGKVRRPTIGIFPAPETKSVIQRVRGVTIASVVPGSPADTVGLRGVNAKVQSPDIITAAGGHEVAQLADLVEVLWQTGIGQFIELTINRNGRLLTVKLPVVDGRFGF